MENLPNALLVEAYNQAKALNLKQDFIELIEKEMISRGLEP